jgi:3-deoxy-D-manno-octulosonic-acid transferase
MSITAGVAPNTQQHRGRQWGLVLRLLIFDLLLLAAVPAIVCWMAWRSLVRRKPMGSWRHRLGLVPRLGSGRGPRIWLHAVSAGEVAAARPVLDSLRATFPSARIAVSTVTTAGMAIARQSCQSADVFCYLPFDAPCCMSRALLRLRPDLVVVTEKELWPNFLGLARLFGARVLVVNGRVSDRTIGRAKWLRGFVTWLYQLPDLLCVQSSQDSKRLLGLGVTPSRVLVAGNTKVDSLSERDARLEAELAADLGIFADDTWLVAGSTHTGEDEAIIDAFGTIRERLPHARLLLAPRHLERVPAVSAMVAQRGFQVVRRSELSRQCTAASARRTESGGEGGERALEAVVILDTIGELRSAYALAAAGFVGGTLVPIGGHNLLEPPAVGRPVIFGPHTSSCSDVAEMVTGEQVGFCVDTAQELAERFVCIVKDSALRSRIGLSAERLMRSQRGAAGRCADAAGALLGLRGAP